MAEAQRERQPFRQPGEKAAEKVAASFLLVAAKEKQGKICFGTATSTRLRGWMMFRFGLLVPDMRWVGAWHKRGLQMAFEGCGRKEYISPYRARHSQRGEGYDAEGGQKDPRKKREYNKERRKGQKQERVKRRKGKEVSPAKKGRKS